MKNNFALNVQYEDEEVLVLSKPPGLLSIPDRYNADLPSVAGILQEKYGGIYTVHRLDKATSGIMVWAKTDLSHKNLNEQFQNRSVRKFYHALVIGTPRDKEGTIDIPILKHPSGGGRMITHKKGKPSVSNYRVVEVFADYSLMELEILSGRTHQIRLHCQAIGHPLAIDPLYGSNRGIYLSDFKRKYKRAGRYEEQPLINRLTLHSYKLEFDHPKTRDRMQLFCEYPKDFRAVVNQLKKWSA